MKAKRSTGNDVKRERKVRRFVDPQGQKANINGRSLEAEVEATLAQYGVLSVKYSQWGARENIPVSDYKNGLLLKNVPYINYKGTIGRGEFVLARHKYSDVRIEVRSQNVRGTAAEKLPALFENALCFKEETVILVVDGKGFDKADLKWLKDKCKSVKNKTIYMMSLVEFKEWASINLDPNMTSYIRANLTIRK